MKNQSVQKLAKKIVKAGKKALPGILVGGSIVTAWVSGFQAGTAKPEADKRIEKRKEELGTEKLTVGETVKTTAPVYAKSAITGAASIAMAGAGIGIEAARMGAVTSTLNEVRKEYNNYKSETQKVVGEEKEKQIQEETARKTQKDRPQPPANVDIPNDGSTYLMFDVLTGQYFKGNEVLVDKAVNDFNIQLCHGSCMSVNDWADCLDEYVQPIASKKIEHTPSNAVFGYHSDNGLFGYHPAAGFSDSGVPMTIIEPNFQPEYDYEHSGKSFRRCY